MRTPVAGRRTWLHVIAVLVCSFLAYGLWKVVECVREASEAEQTLHACINTSDLIEEFVSKHDGNWPRSWDDLQGLGHDNPRFGAEISSNWPGFREESANRVRIDFAADPSRLASLPIVDYQVKDFKAIEPIGPVYNSFDRHFYRIVNALQKFHSPASQETQEGKTAL